MNNGRLDRTAGAGAGLLAALAHNGSDVSLRRAGEHDVAAIVRLLADDPLGANRESADLEPYRQAFHAVDADPGQLLVVTVDRCGSRETVVATQQLSFIPPCAHRSRPCGSRRATAGGAWGR